MEPRGWGMGPHHLQDRGTMSSGYQEIIIRGTHVNICMLNKSINHTIME